MEDIKRDSHKLKEHRSTILRSVCPENKEQIQRKFLPQQFDKAMHHLSNSFLSNLGKPLLKIFTLRQRIRGKFFLLLLRYSHCYQICPWSSSKNKRVISIEELSYKYLHFCF
ncbi:hypothetical protein CEXT_553601 [Caerostris extrusa]|uniref:Uncharacterized protein n=1 Tax=Caerostris extrusa TaxID=172846 RepID=A0AAV4Q5H7_CAEEX|nr:hypothetical protein CEXT_553601 [Caerostris extrusa]